MENMLVKDDICGLGNETTLNSSIDNSTVKQHISDALEYACTFWVSHVAEVEDWSLLNGKLVKFFDVQVLRWIECMSLLGKLGVAVSSLRKLEMVAKVCCLHCVLHHI